MKERNQYARSSTSFSEPVSNSSSAECIWREILSSLGRLRSLELGVAIRTATVSTS